MAERIRVEAPQEGEHVDFKGQGWKFKHLRLWEDAGGAAVTAEVISERIAGWRLLDETGQEIAFKPGRSALDELPPETARWLVGTAFLKAYSLAGKPDPNE